MPNLRYTLRVTGLFLGLAVAPPSSAYERLGEYNVDPSQVSVSGLSSGGAGMAAQLGVAYASRIMGVGVFAAWPYDCRRAGRVTLNSCEGVLTPDIAPLEANMRRWSGVENDPVDYLKRQRIYVFAGAHDNYIGPTVVGQTAKLFERFADPGNVRYETTIDAGHMSPTDFDHPLSTSRMGMREK